MTKGHGIVPPLGLSPPCYSLVVKNKYAFCFVDIISFVFHNIYAEEGLTDDRAAAFYEGWYYCNPLHAIDNYFTTDSQFGKSATYDD
jgi:hypothetical protein